MIDLNSLSGRVRQLLHAIAVIVYIGLLLQADDRPTSQAA